MAVSARDTIAQAIELVCSDGNADRFLVADDVIRALHQQGFGIVVRPLSSAWSTAQTTGEGQWR